MYRSIMVIKLWRELKDQWTFGEVSRSVYLTKREEQIKECNSLLTYIGNPLYLNIYQKKLTDFCPSSRQCLITAFFNYVDILVRIKKFKLAKEICDYVIQTGPKNFQTQFSSKREWINSIMKKNRS